jgi:hypothetical protein
VGHEKQRAFPVLDDDAASGGGAGELAGAVTASPRTVKTALALTASRIPVVLLVQATLPSAPILETAVSSLPRRIIAYAESAAVTTSRATAPSPREVDRSFFPLVRSMAVTDPPKTRTAPDSVTTLSTARASSSASFHLGSRSSPSCSETRCAPAAPSTTSSASPLGTARAPFSSGSLATTAPPSRVDVDRYSPCLPASSRTPRIVSRGSSVRISSSHELARSTLQTRRFSTTSRSSSGPQVERAANDFGPPASLR